MNTTETRHTEGTWTVSPILSNKNEDGTTKYYATIFAHYKGDRHYVCDLDFGYGQKVDQANAAHIVRACNNHHKFIAMLLECAGYLEARNLGPQAALLASEIIKVIEQAERGADEGGI